jgi:hypothetical protein
MISNGLCWADCRHLLQGGNAERRDCILLDFDGGDHVPKSTVANPSLRHMTR